MGGPQRHRHRHDFHLHGTSFRVLDGAGRPAPGALSGWKDTVLVGQGQTARPLVRFDLPDLSVPLMYHCHLLQHEDRRMTGQALVLEPGQRAALAPAAGQDRGHDG